MSFPARYLRLVGEHLKEASGLKVGKLHLVRLDPTLKIGIFNGPGVLHRSSSLWRNFQGQAQIPPYRLPYDARFKSQGSSLSSRQPNQKLHLWASFFLGRLTSPVRPDNLIIKSPEPASTLGVA